MPDPFYSLLFFSVPPFSELLWLWNPPSYWNFHTLLQKLSYVIQPTSFWPLKIMLYFFLSLSKKGLLKIENLSTFLLLIEHLLFIKIVFVFFLIRGMLVFLLLLVFFARFTVRLYGYSWSLENNVRLF